ncbi:MAG: toxin-antitoxin system YwqK family antitoxin [Bacteroidia bacterium]
MKNSLGRLLLFGFVFSLKLLEAQNGFTNKKEAKNESIDGLKQGKWIGYYDANGDNTTPENAASYGLIVYKDDKICEVRRDYFINGKLKQENAYTDGVLNGMSKWYSLYSQDATFAVDVAKAGALQIYDPNTGKPQDATQEQRDNLSTGNILPSPNADESTPAKSLSEGLGKTETHEITHGLGTKGEKKPR